MDSSQSNPKVSDSAYSNSCSNSQSQRSGSSKSRHSGSHSSGGSSSGYGGKPSTVASNGFVQQPVKRTKEKERKKKRSKNSPQSPSQQIIPEGQIADLAIPGPSKADVAATIATGMECGLGSPVLDVCGAAQSGNDSIQSNHNNNNSASFPMLIQSDEEPGHLSPVKSSTPAPEPLPLANSPGQEPIIIPAPPVTDEYALVKHYADLQNKACPADSPIPEPTNAKSDKHAIQHEDGFCCVISMHDGVVLFTSPTITESLGFPRDMWLGRSFIDFVHPKNRHTFANQISSGVPFVESRDGNNLSRESKNYMYVMLRKYRGLKSFGFGIAGNDVIYEPYKLVLNFREGPDAKKEDVGGVGDKKKQPYTSTMLLIISATPVTHFYKHPDEVLNRSPRFALRHNCTGIITHVDGTAVSAFGYLPQDMIGRSIFDFFHPEDLGIIKEIYEQIVEIAKTTGGPFCGSPYRFQIQNGCYVTLDTEWACFINPWSRQLEFIIGHHRVLKGPGQIKIFQPGMEQIQFKDDLLKLAAKTREEIVQTLSEPVFKEGANTKHQASKRCQALASFMETLMEEVTRSELKLELPHDADMTISERDSVMLGEISPHHDYYDSKSSSETPPSYNQLNYNENLNRFFESKPEDAIKIDNQEVTAAAQAAEESTESGEGASVAPQIVTSENETQSGSPQQRFGSSGTGSAINFSSGSNLNMGSTTNTSNTGTSSGSYQPPALTEALLNKHNDDMEKLLLKRHRDIRATNRSEKNKKTNKNTSLEGTSKQQQQQAQQMQQCQLQVPTSTTEAQSGAGLIAHGTKRGGSNSWEGLETYHRTSKHQHVNEDNGNMVPSVSAPATNLMAVPPVNSSGATTSATRSPYTQQSASSLMRNIELWPPFSANLTTMRPSSMPVQAPNPFHANPGIFRTMYYIPQPQQQPNHGSEHPGPPRQQPHNPTGYQYMTGIMLPHAPLFDQQILYHPMYYQPVVPIATDQQPQPQPQPVQQTSIEMPTSLFMNSTGYVENPINTPVSKASTLAAASLSCSRPTMFQRPPSQTTSTKAGPGSSSASAAFTSENYKKWVADSPFNSIPENVDLNSDNDMRDTQKNRSSDEMEESSYSSLYSSFLRTDSSSNEESRLEPPWLENVRVTSDLIYRYRKSSQPLTDVLEADLASLKLLTQPGLVNDQLAQLYLDLELEGLGEKLCLSEQNFSCSSEDEDWSGTGRKKMNLSNLVMIYDENAALPPIPVTGEA